jgi:activating signal cointegrator complex subunit 3
VVPTPPEVDLSLRTGISLAGTPLDEAQQLVSKLPSGTTRVVSKGIEEVTVPPPPPAPGSRHKLVPVSAIAPWQMCIFSGLKQFNEVQSVVFNSAYNSSNNMLVCAPTGAGKTNIALLTIARELLLHMRDGVLHTADFKIVFALLLTCPACTSSARIACNPRFRYVAPMKALAAEVTQKFSEKLGSCGVVVKELTGDMQLTQRELQATQVIVTTPEKWDVITRKSTDSAFSLLVHRRLLSIFLHSLSISLPFGNHQHRFACSCWTRSTC